MYDNLVDFATSLN